MSKVGKKLIQGLNECLEYEQGKRHDLRTFAEVVFCKDCKYCDRHHLVDGLFCYRLYEKYNKEYPQMIIEVEADDFCSRGEKKDDNENND